MSFKREGGYDWDGFKYIGLILTVLFGYNIWINERGRKPGVRLHCLYWITKKRQPFSQAQRCNQNISHWLSARYILTEIGHSRIKEELIPYLIEIIEQMDNDIEFLIKVCEGILDLKQFCKNSN